MHWLQEVGRCVWCTPTAVIFALLSSLENLPLINSRKIIFSSLKCFFLRFCEYWSLFFLLWSSQTFMEKSRYRATLLCVRPAATALDKGSCFSEKTKKKGIKQTPELLHGEWSWNRGCFRISLDPVHFSKMQFFHSPSEMSHSFHKCSNLCGVRDLALF